MEKLDAILNAHRVKDGPGFACGIIRGGEVVYTAVRGESHIETKDPITPDTTFRLASVTKQFIAGGVLLLAKERRLSLDDTLPAFFPAFPAYGHGITIRHLLTHTSGLRDYEELLPKGSFPVDDTDVLALLQGEREGYFLPGARYRYSNGGYCLLHLIIEEVTGQPLDLFLTERVFVPLGMERAFIHTAGMPDTVDMAYGHSPSERGYVLHNHDRTSWTIGDGGMYASLRDMLAWGRALRSRTIDGTDLSEMFVPQTETLEPGCSYGYGLVILDTPGRQTIYHEGETVGFRTCVYTRPVDDVYIVALFNRDDVDPLRVCYTLADAVSG